MNDVTKQLDPQAECMHPQAAMRCNSKTISSSTNDFYHQKDQNSVAVEDQACFVTKMEVNVN